MAPPMTAGDRLVAARLAAGLTQEKLSELIGFSQTKISKVENDDQGLTMDEAERWASVCGTSPQLLMPKTATRVPKPATPNSHPAGKPAREPVLSQAVQDSLDSYIDRHRHLLSDVQIQRLPFLAKGVNPMDRKMKVDDRYWDDLAIFIRDHYSDDDAN